MAKQKINAAPSVRRLPSYLNIIQQFAREKKKEKYISGTVIARELNLEPIQVRKDLAITGITGKPKKGYPVEALAGAIESFLGWDSGRDAVLAGAGNLGTALLGYEELRRHGLRFVAAFDKNSRKIGETIHGVRVLSVDQMEEEIRRQGVKTAILTVPPPSAQETADILVRGGIEAIWNFTNTLLKVPDRVAIRREDLSSGYAMLCVMLKMKETGDDAD
jgi:redox-sensing transcriptional repressor